MANKQESWYKEAAERMVREDKNLVQVAMEMELPLNSRELLNIERRKSFQEILWGERNKFYASIAADPQRTKNAMVGAMTLAINKLIQAGDWKEAVEAILKLAKLEGWIGTEGVNFFQGLSEKQLREIEGKLGTSDRVSAKGTPKTLQ